MHKEKFYVVFSTADYKTLRAAVTDDRVKVYDTAGKALGDAEPEDIILECSSVSILEREYKTKVLELKGQEF